MLLDSNILIYASKPCTHQEKAAKFLCDPKSCISAITYLEVLGYHKLGPLEKSTIEIMLEQIEILSITDQVIKLATSLRQDKSMSMGDAIIAATAIKFEKSLVTVNDRDFRHLESLRIISLD